MVSFLMKNTVSFRRIYNTYMKIITDNAVYVQKGDINYLFYSDMSTPKSIFDKVYGIFLLLIIKIILLSSINLKKSSF